nr:hypothetical protein [Tanacetum cinerariifolium]
MPSTQICYKPFRSSLSLSSSKSRLCSFAIKCSNNDAQKKVVNLVDKFSGFVEEVLNVNDMQKFMWDVQDIVLKSDDDFVSDIVYEVLNKDDREVKDLGRGSARARKRIEWAKSQYLRQEIEIKNFKAYVNRLQNRASEARTSSRALRRRLRESKAYIKKSINDNGGSLISSLGARSEYLEDSNNSFFGLSEPSQLLYQQVGAIQANSAPRVNIQKFCEEHYEDILPIIMEKVHHDRRKDVHTRLDFGEGPRERVREDSNSNTKARATEPG